MDCFAISLLIFFWLAVIAVVGRVIWGGFAIVFKGIFGSVSGAIETATAPKPKSERRRCIRCTTKYSVHLPICPSCGLDPLSLRAQELTDLETTVRTLQAMVEDGHLEPEAAEAVYRRVELRQTELIKPQTDAAPVIPLEERLQHMLGVIDDPDLLTGKSRQLALSWYRQMQPEMLEKLQPRGLWNLARILEQAGLSSRALDVYDLLMKREPCDGFAKAAIEALQLACKQGQLPLARSWLRVLRERLPVEEDQRRLNEFEAQLPVEFAVPVAAAKAPATAESQAALPPISATITPIPLADPEPSPEAPRKRKQAKPVEPPPVKVGIGQMFAGFMEERNILWGELVGGLLIVGCSIALVFSLWETLEKIPYFPFLAMAAITLGLFGAGLYTLVHWKLQATSRGLLVIASLLTPLDFLVLAGLTKGRASNWFDWVMEAAAALGLGAMVRKSGRVLLGQDGGRCAPTLLAVAVVGGSLSQVLVTRWLDSAFSHLGLFLVLSLGPVLFHALGVGSLLVPMSRQDTLSPGSANRLMLFLGQTLFVALVALGFILYWSGDHTQTLRHLALPIAVTMAPLLWAGVLVQSRLRPANDDESYGHGLQPGILAVLGILCESLGIVALLGTLVLAWPRPLALGSLGLGLGAGFGILAVVFQRGYLHLPGLVAFAVGFLTCFHTALGEWNGDQIGVFRDIVRTSPTTAAIGWTLLAALSALAGEAVTRWRGASQGRYHFLFAALAVWLALVLAGVGGSDRPLPAACVYLAITAGIALVNLRWRQGLATLLASAILLGAIAFLFWAGERDQSLARLWLLSLLTHASLLTAFGVFVRPWLTGPREETGFRVPILGSGMTAAIVAILPLVGLVQWGTLPICITCLIWMTFLWLIIAWQEGWTELWAAGQLLSGVTVLFAATHWLGSQHWALQNAHGLIDARSLQIYALSLTVWCGSWMLLRRLTSRWEKMRHLLSPGVHMPDNVLLPTLIVAHWIMAGVAMIPEIHRELWASPRVLQITMRLDWSWWLFLGNILLLLVRPSRRADRILEGLVLALTAPILLALGFRDELASASAARWLWAIDFLFLSVLLWLRDRVVARFDWDLSGLCRVILLVGSAFPVLLVTFLVAQIGFLGGRPVGPDLASVFAEMGWTLSMVGPLGLIAVAFLGHGIRENKPGYWFSNGLLLTVSSVGGAALQRVIDKLPLDNDTGLFLLQLAILIESVWGLTWLATRRWRHSALLVFQFVYPGVLQILLLGVALATLFLQLGGTLPAFWSQIASWTGWFGFAAWIAGCFWVACWLESRWALHLVVIAGIGAGILEAWSWAESDPTGWRSYHVLTLCWTLLALTLTTLAWVGESCQKLGPAWWLDERRLLWGDRLRGTFPGFFTRRWVETICLAVLGLALGGVSGDPQSPLGSCLAAGAVLVLLFALAIWTRRPGYVFLTGIVGQFISYLIWQSDVAQATGLSLWIVADPILTERFVLGQIFALALGSIVWSLLDLYLRGHDIDLRGRFAYAHVAAGLAYHLCAAWVLLGIVNMVIDIGVSLDGPWQWMVLAATALASLACAWDAEAGPSKLPAAPLYGLGLCALGLGLHQAKPPHLPAWGTLGLAAYLWLSALLAIAGNFWKRLARSLRMPARDDWWYAGWWAPQQMMLALVVIGLGFWLCLAGQDHFERLAGAGATGLLVLAGATMVWVIPDLELRSATLTTLALACTTAAWALLDPAVPVPWLHRQILLLVVLLLLGSWYASSWFGLGGDWTDSARPLGRLLLGQAGVLLPLILAQEFFLYDPVERTTPLTGQAKAGLAILLIAAVATLFLVGLLRKETRFIWAMELAAVLLLVHLRLTVPDLFPTFIGQRWTFVVMILGFLGVGAGEWCRRRGVLTLAKPWQTTGLVLPWLPMAGYLVKPIVASSEIGVRFPGLQPFLRYLDLLPAAAQTQALLWLLMGILYGWLAFLWRKAWPGVIGALAVNLGWWVILNDLPGFEFVRHPQFWLIPLGLIVLISESLQRPRLTPEAGQGLRYLGLLLIVGSTSADMFIAGLGKSVVWPLAAAFIAIIGVLLGMLLRVRAYLFVGVALLVEVIFAQIWHAAVDLEQTWVWWASGIVMGIAILTLFALFEKRRDDVLEVVEKMKSWE